MGCISSGGESYEDVNYSHWLDQKHPLFYILVFSENNKWGTTSMCMNVAELDTKKTTVRVKASIY